MVAMNKATTGRGQLKKLMLKKETLRDLAPRKGGTDAVRGGGSGLKRTYNSCNPCSF